MPTSVQAVSSRLISRDVRQSRFSRDTLPEQSTQLTDHLRQQGENSLLHKKYLEMQINRTQIAIERVELQKRLVEIEVYKAETLMGDEIQHKKDMMKLELIPN